jgi:hypothetical protein
MKLCKDCKYHDAHRLRIGGYNYDSPLCRRGQTYVILDLVNGSGYHEGEEMDCHVEREDALRLEEFRCGKEGKFWEAK